MNFLWFYFDELNTNIRHHQMKLDGFSVNFSLATFKLF